jgi:hypothetical protein
MVAVKHGKKRMVAASILLRPLKADGGGHSRLRQMAAVCGDATWLLAVLRHVPVSETAGSDTMRSSLPKPTVSPLIIPLVYCYINGFQRASSVEKPWPGGEKKRDGWAAQPVAW